MKINYNESWPLKSNNQNYDWKINAKNVLWKNDNLKIKIKMTTNK